MTSRSPWVPAIPLAVVIGGQLRLLGSGTSRIVASGSAISGLLWSPDGRWLLFKRPLPDGKESAWVVRADGSGFREETSDTDAVVAWSATGDYLLIGSSAPFGTTSAVKAVQPAGGSRVIGRFPGTVESIAASDLELAVSAARFSQPTGFRLGSLMLVPVGGGKTRTVATSDSDSFDAAGFFPDGKTLLYYTDPSNSASIAADGVEYRTYSLAAGSDSKLGIGLVSPSWRSWSPDGTRLAITLGDSRAAWATDKHVVTCVVAAHSCTTVSSPRSRISFEPSYGAGNRFAYVTADGLGGPEGFSGGAPLGAAGVDRWAETFRIWIASAAGRAIELTKLGAASAPEWVGGGPGLLVVRSGALWYVASPTGAPERITDDYLPTGFSDYGSYDWRAEYRTCSLSMLKCDGLSGFRTDCWYCKGVIVEDYSVVGPQDTSVRRGASVVRADAGSPRSAAGSAT